MEDQVTNMHEILEDFEPHYTNIGVIVGFDYVDAEWRAINNDMGEYREVWIEFEGVDDEHLADLDDDYDRFEEDFTDFLDENYIEYEKVLVRSEDDSITYAVTIRI